MNTEKEIPYWPMISTIFIGSFLIMLSTSTINIAIPYLMKNFNTGLESTRWTITGYMMAMGTVAPITAYLGERFSYKKIYLVSIIGFTIASLLCSFATSIPLLITFRILQGAFSGLSGPATMAMIYHVVPKEKLASAISIWSLGAMLAPALGPTISGLLLQYFSWKSIFMINLPLGAMAIFMGFKFMPDYKLTSPSSFDAIGFFAILMSSLALLFSFSEGNSWGWTSFRISSLLVSGLIILGVFIWRELNTASPILNIRVFKYKKYTFSVIVSSIINIGLYAGMLITPLFLQNLQHNSPLDTGLILLPASLAMALMMPLVGKLCGLIDSVFIIVLGILLMALGSWNMAHLSINASNSYIITWMTARNVGIAFCTMPVTLAGMSDIPAKLSGHASSVNNWTRQLVGSLSIGIFTSMLISQTKVHARRLAASDKGLQLVAIQRKAFLMAVNDVYFISFIIILIAIPISFFLKNKELPDLTQIEELAAQA